MKLIFKQAEINPNKKVFHSTGHNSSIGHYGIWFKFVKHLPKKLIYFCAMQLGVEVTTGKYSNTVVPELTFMNAVKRFGDDYKI